MRVRATRLDLTDTDHRPTQTQTGTESGGCQVCVSALSALSPALGQRPHHRRNQKPKDHHRLSAPVPAGPPTCSRHQTATRHFEQPRAGSGQASDGLSSGDVRQNLGHGGLAHPAAAVKPMTHSSGREALAVVPFSPTWPHLAALPQLRLLLLSRGS